MLEELLNQLGSSLGLGGLTLEKILYVALLTIVGAIVIRILMRVVDRLLDRSKSVARVRTYVHSVVKILLWALLALMVTGSLGVDVSSVIALLSVAGLAVSLALQNTLANLAGGLMILLSRPFVVGDYIETDGLQGTVAGIDLAYTTLDTVDNKQIFIPNSQISAAKVVNFNRLSRRRVDMVFSASYDAPTAVVKTAIGEAMDHFPQILRDPEPVVYLSQFGDSSISYQVRIWTEAQDYWDVYFGMNEAVRETFAAHDVEMTYNHLNVHVMKEE